MQDFRGKFAVITGGGAGIGRELCRKLTAQGCHVATCDVVEANLAETLELCRAENPHDANLNGFVCDVADEAQVQQFCRDFQTSHATDHVDLLINNAGISGGGSFIESTRTEWERTFNICWSGVYLVTRTFMPLLLKSAQGHLVNMSSANGLRAVLGGHLPHTAYSAAKFAVRGFSEALIHDFRFNAPHLCVSVVFPGHIGTEIMSNSAKILGHNEPENWTEAEVDDARTRWKIAGRDELQGLNDDQIRTQGRKEIDNSRNMGLAPAVAADVVLEGVRNKTWRIVIGKDTQSLDLLVRESPESAYDVDFVDRWREAYSKLSEGD
jgi:NAD(P)-dependent dehydrogenase (short-subunit alcohol dehydrogenase family)